MGQPRREHPLTTILFCGTGWLPIVEAIRERLPQGCTVRSRSFDRPLLDEVREADVLLPSNAPFDAAVVEAAKRAILIQQPAVGVDGIDLGAAKRRGVPVCNTPAVNADSVAEATVYFLLALARRAPEARVAFEAPRIGEPVGIELRGKTLGVVGVGATGSRVADLARALGMNVVSIRSSSSKDAFHDLLARSDYVTVHCPLTKETRGLFDRDVFSRMKPGACLVNCARGAIVDRTALEEALESGRLGGVGIDAFWQEPWNPADPLFTRSNVVVLPHVAGSTREAFGRVADIVVENVRRVLSGEELLYRVA